MTVSELIELLMDAPQDAEVHFAYNYGDHARTQVAPVVHSVEEGYVFWSDYFSQPVVSEDEDEVDEDAQPVVIIT